MLSNHFAQLTMMQSSCCDLIQNLKGVWADELQAKPVWNARVGEDCVLCELHLSTIGESADATRH